MPQFRQLYPIIFEGIKIKRLPKVDDNYFIAEHFRNLIKNKSVQEVKFYLEKGMECDNCMIELILKTCNQQMLQVLNHINKNDVQQDFDSLYGSNDICVELLMKNGFHPSKDGIRKAYCFRRNKNAKDLGLIELLPPDIKLDFF